MARSEKKRRITQPYIDVVPESLPPPALQGEADEERFRRSESPTTRIRVSSPPSSSTQYSFIDRSRRK